MAVLYYLVLTDIHMHFLHKCIIMMKIIEKRDL